MAVNLEEKLRPPELQMAPYPPKTIMLANGQFMLVREVSREEVPVLLKAVHPTLFVDSDFYDLVGSRLYSELLGWVKHRVRNEFCLAGLVDGELWGIVNSRMYDKNIGISLHTLTLKRGFRVGQHLFAAKMEHHMEFLGQKEVYITAEGPIGFRKWMIEFELIYDPNIQHELGGAKSFTLTRALWDKHKPRLCVGRRPVPQELLDVSYPIRIPDEWEISAQVALEKGKQRSMEEIKAMERKFKTKSGEESK